MEDEMMEDELVGVNQPLRARAMCDEDGPYVEVDWIEGIHSATQYLSASYDVENTFAEDECTLVVRKAREGHLVADFIVGFEEPETWTLPFVINDLDDWPDDWIR